MGWMGCKRAYAITLQFGKPPGQQLNGPSQIPQSHVGCDTANAALVIDLKRVHHLQKHIHTFLPNTIKRERV